MATVVEQQTQERGAEAARTKAPAEDRERLFRQLLWHLVAAISVVALWAAADTWRLVTDLPAATGVAVAASVVFGIAFSSLLHEWGHFLGARLTGAVSPVKAQPALLMFDFDFEKNSNRQFLAMSIAGTLGTWLFVLLVWLAIPLDSAGRAMLLAAGVGLGAFVAVFEWPVIAHAWRHGDPMAALMHRFGGDGLPRAFAQAVGAGIIAALVVWAFLLL